MDRFFGTPARSSWALMTTLTMLSCLGCMTEPRQAGPPPTQTISYRIPLFTPSAETKELQEKSGLEISVTSIPYETKDETVEERGRVLYAGVSRVLTPDGSADVPFRVFERTTHGTVTVSPDRVGFIITINNKMNHVFRGQGAVVQFNVAGRTTSVEQQNYSELSNMILPPRNQQQIKIYGPKLTDLPDGPVPIGLMIYDVVTTTDAAGNATERQNFQWIFSYSADVKQKEVQVTKSRVREQSGPAMPVQRSRSF